MEEVHHAREVISELRAFAERIRSIENSIKDRKSLSHGGKEDLQTAYAALKADVKEAAKRGTIGVRHRAQTEFERCYFAPAMRKASIELRAKTNSHPITSNWPRSLRDAESEIDYYLFQMKKEYPDV